MCHARNNGLLNRLVGRVSAKGKKINYDPTTPTFPNQETLCSRKCVYDLNQPMPLQKESFSSGSCQKNNDNRYECICNPGGRVVFVAFSVSNSNFPTHTIIFKIVHFGLNPCISYYYTLQCKG